jgi:hypothetical protein
MASYTYVGFYTGSTSGGTFTTNNTYSALGGPYTIDDGQGGSDFDVAENVDHGLYTYMGYTAAGEIVVTDGNLDYLYVPAGGDTGRASGAQISYTAGTFVTCFLRGTLILTARGEVKVEALREGDLVATRFGGLRPIRWIGTQRFDGRFAGRATAPIRFARGSLGGGMPSCDLFVSPGHAVLAGEVLAHAGALVNGSTITQERVRGVIEYFHLDLGPHDCVLANGAWAESYFEDRNRDAFHNAPEFHARFPGHTPVRQETCLPIMTAAHPAMEGLRAMLAPAAMRAAA